MRAQGSLHQKTGEVVQAYRWRIKPYSLEEFDTFVSFAPGAVDVKAILAAVMGKYDLSVNGNALVDYPAFSYVQAAERCGAMRKAALRNGAETPHDAWMLEAKTAALSIEGRDYAHEVSCGHPDYESGATDKKIDSLTGGPAGCEAWANAWGAGGPCDTCKYNSTVKNPAVQLGALVNVAPPGEVAQSTIENVVPWIAELNQRFALVPHSTKLVVADFKTPSMGGCGMSYGVGFLEIAGFRSMMNRRFAPIQKAGEKQRALSDSWLSHRQRRQYEGLVYGPGEVLPCRILNLWRDFAVEPVAGDVSPWLDVLAALVANEAERRYVLHWIAWKI